MFDDFFKTAHELTQRGEAFATAVVVRAEKPTSGKPGDRAIILRDGTLIGWIGGSCAQPTVIREARQALAEDTARLIRLSPDPASQVPREGLRDVAMTCFSGGTLEIHIEPHHPRPRMVIVGNLPVARSLAHLGAAMNYQVIALDPEGGAVMQGADLVITQLGELGAHITPASYVVVATHGTFDETAVESALRAGAHYVGLVASPRRGESVRAFLREAGLSDGDMLAFKAPAGLDIHARRGDEIALSIMAEIVQRRRASETLHRELFTEPASKTSAVCPACKGEVDPATCQNTSELAGVTYYFCCPHCKSRFDKNPARYFQTT